MDCLKQLINNLLASRQMLCKKGTSPLSGDVVAYGVLYTEETSLQFVGIAVRLDWKAASDAITISQLFWSKAM